MPLRLRHAADAYPTAGWKRDGEHFVVISGGIEVGVIQHRTGIPKGFPPWLWSLNVLMPKNDGIAHSGDAETKEEAMAAFSTSWREWVAKAGLVEADRALELEAALDAFTFPAYPEAFRGDETAMTETLVKDSDVQMTRRLRGMP